MQEKPQIRTYAMHKALQKGWLLSKAKQGFKKAIKPPTLQEVCVAAVMIKLHNVDALPLPQKIKIKRPILAFKITEKNQKKIN